MAESFETMTSEAGGHVLEIPNDNEAEDFSDSLFFEHVESLIDFLEKSDDQKERDTKFKLKMEGLMSDLADLIGDKSIKTPGLIIDSLLKKIKFAKQNANLKQSTLRALQYCADDVTDLKKSLEN
jgi:hypothetical protein